MAVPWRGQLDAPAPLRQCRIEAQSERLDRRSRSALRTTSGSATRLDSWTSAHRHAPCRSGAETIATPTCPSREGCKPEPRSAACRSCGNHHSRWAITVATRRPSLLCCMNCAWRPPMRARSPRSVLPPMRRGAPRPRRVGGHGGLTLQRRGVVPAGATGPHCLPSAASCSERSARASARSARADGAGVRSGLRVVSHAQRGVAEVLAGVQAGGLEC